MENKFGSEAHRKMANQVKTERANVVARVKNGSVSVAFLIVNNPKCLHSMEIGALLKKQSRWGQKKVQRLLNRLDIKTNKPIGDLTWRQRNVLADALGNKDVDWTQEVR